MSYQKHTWVTNEIIRSIHLNHIESGIYDEEQRAILAEEELATRIGANTSAINTLNGNSSTAGSVDYKIAQAMADVGGYKVTLDHTQEVNPSTKYIYLEKDTSATGTDKWQEWIYILESGVGTWELIDDISLDLSAYVQKTDLTSSSAFGIVKVDGTTITAEDGVISASGGDVSNKMDKVNPTGTGSLSLNRKASTTVGTNSVAEGENCTASGAYSHAEGHATTAVGEAAHAEGYNAYAGSNYAHAEGYETEITVNGTGCHVEGYKTRGDAEYAHAEGIFTRALFKGAHSEGFGYSGYPIMANGKGSHAEGLASSSKSVVASGEGAHAEGYATTASGNYSHAGGEYNTVAYEAQTAIGKYNSNKSNTLFEVGNGTSTSARSNAFEVYSDGSLSGDNGSTKTKLPVIKTATLAASATSVTFTDMPSSGNNMIDFYTSVPGLNFTAISTSGTSVTLTYPAQSSSVTVYCSIIEVTS